MRNIIACFLLNRNKSNHLTINQPLYSIPFVHVKMGFHPLPNCEQIAPEQTADHVLIACPIHRAPHAAQGLKPEAGSTPSLSASGQGTTAVLGSKKINPWNQFYF